VESEIRIRRLSLWCIVEAREFSDAKRRTFIALRRKLQEK
jgi:hypothetical protein